MYSSPVINAALGLPVDLLKNLRVQGKLRGGILHGRALYYRLEEVLQIGLALRLARLVGQQHAFGLVFDDGFSDELLDALDDGVPLTLVHAHPPHVVFAHAGDLAMSADDALTQFALDRWVRALLVRLEKCRRELAGEPKPAHERIERHESRERRATARWAEYEMPIKGRRRA